MRPCQGSYCEVTTANLLALHVNTASQSSEENPWNKTYFQCKVAVYTPSVSRLKH